MGFLQNEGNITEWVVTSNIENRILNSAISSAQNWWRNRKSNSNSNTPTGSSTSNNIIHAQPYNNVPSPVYQPPPQYQPHQTDPQAQYYQVCIFLINITAQIY